MVSNSRLFFVLLAYNLVNVSQSTKGPSSGFQIVSSVVASISSTRGGADLQPTNSQPTKKRKRRKKSASTVKRVISSTESKDRLNDVLKESDAATALGDAIRSKAGELREETDPELRHIQDSVRSVGLALGASDQYGVEVDPASVLAHYFLKSHGGAHGLQCICSVLAAATGIGALFIKGETQISLLKRCMVFAMIKHVAGLLSASFIAAKGIPLSGYRRAADLMEDLAKDPISQYVFYTATILLWLPRHSSVKLLEGVESSVSSPIMWWQTKRAFSLMLVAPVVLRELISSALVISDVLILWATTAENTNGAKRLLALFRFATNAGMSLLVTPNVWNSADAGERQAILARITSKMSLAFEVLVGCMLMLDCIFSAAGFASGNSGLLRFSKRVICTRLYLQFLWSRRKKIKRLASTIRGGAGHVPFYILNVLMDPQGSMGMKKALKEEKSTGEWTLLDYVRIILGLD